MPKKKQTKTKHKDISYTHINDDLLGFSVEIFAANNYGIGQIIEQSTDHINSTIIQKFKEENKELFYNHNIEAAFVYKDNWPNFPRRYMFFGCNGCDAGLIAHEVMHLAKSVLHESLDADLCDNTEEIYCRFIEYYAQKIFDELKKDGVIE